MTHFQFPAPQPDKTDNPYSGISNQDFLAALCGDLGESTRPLVASVPVDPRSPAAKKHLGGKAWQIDSGELPSDHNNYFTIASFHQADDSTYKRQKRYFHALHAIVLDDIGEKVPLEKITLEPTWIIETSEGNYQVGYALDPLVTDVQAADALSKAFIRSGRTDSGMSGPASRLARLPQAINGKHNPPFACRLIHWKPEVRYSIEELCDAYLLDMEASKPKKAKQQAGLSCDHQVYVPKPDNNPVLDALQSRGLYKKGLGQGKHDITCPWVHEHTDAIDGGTVYFEPNEQYQHGGFKCQHGHCADRRLSQLLETLGLSIEQATHKPIIRMVRGMLHTVIDRAEAELAATGGYYQRGGEIVTVIKDANTGETSIKTLNTASIMPILSKIIGWQAYDGRAQGFVTCDPPERVIKSLLGRTSFHHLPPLNGLAHQPYLRDDGQLVATAGYDRASAIYGYFSPSDFTIMDAPCKADALAAMERIERLLAEFPFAAGYDKAAAIAAILTATIRPSLPAAPMIHCKAPQISSGKSFLCQIITVFASERHGAPMAFPSDEEECRKLLLAELLRAPAVIEFDNLTTDLKPHKSLCTALTSDFLSDRKLGVSESRTVSTRTLFLSSGNNVGPIKDMARRCITINLDPACETPAAREFKGKPLHDLRKNRCAYIADALTIILAWINSGDTVECKPLASYDQWTEWCRKPLLWLGYDDPASSVFSGMKEDPDAETLGAVLTAWHCCFGDKPMRVRDVIDTFHGPSDDLMELFHEVAGERDKINKPRLGHYIKRHQNRLISNHRFLRVQGSYSTAKWKVECIQSGLSD